MVFTITTHNNAVIYADTFPAFDILGDAIEIMQTDAKQIDSIKHRLANYSSDENFLTPAIGPLATFNSETADRAIGQNIRSNRKAIGFGFAHGYEGSNQIAYDPKLKKATYYFMSD